MHRHRVWLLCLGIEFFPLVEAIIRDQAPARLERLAKRGLLRSRLGLGVNQALGTEQN